MLLTNFDPIINYLEYDSLLEIALMNEEFSQWAENQINLLETEQNWYIKWKTGVINSLRTNFDQFKKFADSQVQQNEEWFKTNKDLLTNPGKYPLKVNSIEKKTYNFNSAISRLSKPISIALNGINLDQVEVSDNNIGTEDNIQSKEANLGLKAKIIPKYQGSESFVKAAKNYYSCPYSKHTPNLQQMNALVQVAYKYCNSYKSAISSLQQDLNGLISFINKDPTTGVHNNNQQSDLAKIQAAQTNNGGMASTNPNNNIVGGNKPAQVNADVEYSLFMKEYFDEDVSNIGTVQSANPVPQAQAANTVSNGGNSTTVSNRTGAASNNNSGPKLPNGSSIVKQKDVVSLNSKKKQIAVDIYKDAFNAKMSAVGEIYRAMLLLMRKHVASYKGSDGLSNKK